MPLTHVLLMLAICSVWLPAVAVGARYRLPPWAVLFGVAIAAGLVQGFLRPPAVAALLVLVSLALAAHRLEKPVPRGIAMALLVLLCLALALHRVPGFDNPVVLDRVRITPDAAPFTQYLNFDKGSVGLVLLALLSPRLRRGDPLGRLARDTAIGLASTALVVFGVALAAGLVRVDAKLPAAAALFLLTNLFFTCVAEETFFRTLVHDPLRGGGRWGGRGIAALWLSALLFGLAHAGGGPMLMAMAGLAGLGYGAVYVHTGRIEAAVLVHFGINALHFLFFTYPALQR